jgi:hypothetical protein
MCKRHHGGKEQNELRSAGHKKELGAAGSGLPVVFCVGGRLELPRAFERRWARARRERRQRPRAWELMPMRPTLGAGFSAASLALTVGLVFGGCGGVTMAVSNDGGASGAADGGPLLAGPSRGKSSGNADAKVAIDGSSAADATPDEGAPEVEGGVLDGSTVPSLVSGPDGQHPKLDQSSNRLEIIGVSPHAADPELASSLASEQEFGLWDTRVRQRERLVVLVPSEGADPVEQIELGQIVVGYGYQVVLPGYINRGYAPTCNDPSRCSTAEIYREQLEGVDVSDALEVTPPNSLERRIARMLSYLGEQNPAGDWTFYLSGNVPRWDRIVVAGFSGGGTMAAFVALHRNVSRAVMLEAPWSPNQGIITAPTSLTPSDAFYGFVHQRADHFAEVTLEWLTLGLGWSPIVVVDAAAAPYGQSHRLESDASVSVPACAHFSVMPGTCSPTGPDGAYLFSPVWRYLFTGE